MGKYTLDIYPLYCTLLARAPSGWRNLWTVPKKKWCLSSFYVVLCSFMCVLIINTSQQVYDFWHLNFALWLQKKSPQTSRFRHWESLMRGYQNHNAKCGCKGHNHPKTMCFSQNVKWFCFNLTFFLLIYEFKTQITKVSE